MLFDKVTSYCVLTLVGSSDPHSHLLTPPQWKERIREVKARKLMVRGKDSLTDKAQVDAQANQNQEGIL